MTKNINSRSSRNGFTLVELILVMLLLSTIGALVAPSLSKSFRQQALDREATRFYSLTEYGRSEAISQGVPMVIWIEKETRRFGVKSKEGYATGATRNLEYVLDPEVQFVTTSLKDPNATDLIEFDPEGSITLESTPTIQIQTRTGSSLWITQTRDGWGYQIDRENKDVLQTP